MTSSLGQAELVLMFYGQLDKKGFIIDECFNGGGITVPGARLYDNDGHWFWEGEGVAPDIEVWDDPNILVKGRDPQMERVVDEVMKLVKTNPPRMTPAPALEDRTAKGLNSKK